MILTLRGNTKVKLEIQFLDKKNRKLCIVCEGRVDLNFVYDREGKIGDLFRIELYKESLEEVS